MKTQGECSATVGVFTNSGRNRSSHHSQHYVGVYGESTMLTLYRENFDNVKRP